MALKHRETRLEKLTNNVLAEIFSAFLKLAKLIAAEIFFCGQKRVYFGPCNCSKEKRSSFQSAFSIRGVEFIQRLCISPQLPRIWRKLSFLFRATIRIFIKNRGYFTYLLKVHFVFLKNFAIYLLR